MSNKWHIRSGGGAGAVELNLTLDSNDRVVLTVGKGSSYGKGRGGNVKKANANSCVCTGTSSILTINCILAVVCTGGRSHDGTTTSCGGSVTKTNNAIILSKITNYVVYNGYLGSYHDGNGHGALSATVYGGCAGIQISNYGIGGGGIFSKPNYSTGFNGFPGNGGYVKIEYIGER